MFLVPVSHFFLILVSMKLHSFFCSTATHAPVVVRIGIVLGGWSFYHHQHVYCLIGQMLDFIGAKLFHTTTLHIMFAPWKSGNRATCLS